MSDQVQDQGTGRSPRRGGSPFAGLQDAPRTSPVRSIPASDIKSLAGNGGEDRFAKAFDQRMVTDEDVIAYYQYWADEFGYVDEDGFADIEAIWAWTGFYKSPVNNHAVNPAELSNKEMRDIVTKDMHGPYAPARKNAPAPVIKKGLGERLAERAKHLGRGL